MELRHCGIMASILEGVPEALGNSTTPGERQWMQKALVRLILATDMARHIELLKLFEATMPTPDAYLGNKPPGDPTAAEAEQLFESERTTSGATVQEEHALCAMDTLLKMADISNVAKPHKVARRWASLVTEEFYRQGDAERQLGLEPIPNFDRRQGGSATALAQSQLGFIRFMVLPMYTSCHAHLFSGLHWWVEGLQRNIELYEQEKSSDGKIVGGVAAPQATA
jgi:cAMP-specific phosphodiesterase